jgi:hypothetical protein
MPKKRTPPPGRRKRPASVADVVLTVQDASVTCDDKPRRERGARTIHPRRPAPGVPRGKPVPDSHPTAPVDVEEPDD